MNKPKRASLFVRIRRNHGLEHATINVLSERHPGLRLAGYSTPFGFYIIGPVTLDTLTNAIQEARQRVSGGRRGLVIHDRCGTNYVAGGILAGFAAWMSMLGARRKLNRLPLVILVATLALLFSPRLGTWLQRHVTTSSYLDGLDIIKIKQGQFGKFNRYTVNTSNY
ncbi:MAG: hypothetical protein JW704_07535 [Anaerolineaceae bacterium]|mgnify:CR=1 FL=1|nr:hypothetical protein [Anaerolineaceae bacterium]MBN2677387.1 hypothetical protein [Anaerolineaceae bacterium]